MPSSQHLTIAELYNQPYEIMTNPLGGFTKLPYGINVVDANNVARGMHRYNGEEGRRVDFYDRHANGISIPRDNSGNKPRSYFEDGYARLIWDFMNGNILLGRTIRGFDILYVRDIDSGEYTAGRAGEPWVPRTLNTWHVLDIPNEYHIPPSKWDKAWERQLMFECSRLDLRVIHGIKFNNAVFMRENFNPDAIRANGNQVPKNGNVVRFGPENDKFNWPYELTLDIDYSPELSQQARKYLEFVTVNDGDAQNGAIGDSSHSADNLTRFFATPLLESYKHLTFVLYGGGGNGKGILMQSFEQTPGLEHGMCASVDSQKLLGGQKGSGGFATDNEALKLKTALWAYDEEATDITLAQMTTLKKISTGDPIVARAIQQNSVNIYPKAVFAICTNNPVISTMTAASARRLAFIRMRDGRKPEEFKDMLAFRDRYGAAAWIMASCDMWLNDTGRPEGAKDFWDDVAIGDASDLSQAEEWIADQIVRNGYAISSQNPYREDAQDHKNTIAKLGLKSTTKRVKTGKDDTAKPMRVLVVAHELRFAPYRQAINEQWSESGTPVQQIEAPRPTPVESYDDGLPEQLPTLADLPHANEPVESPTVNESTAPVSEPSGSYLEAPDPTTPMDDAYFDALAADIQNEPDF